MCCQPIELIWVFFLVPDFHIYSPCTFPLPLLVLTCPLQQSRSLAAHVVVLELSIAEKERDISALEEAVEMSKASEEAMREDLTKEVRGWCYFCYFIFVFGSLYLVSNFHLCFRLKIRS